MKNRGFTLIELMIVIAIIAILAMVIGPMLGNMGGARGSGEDAKSAAMSHYAQLYPEYQEFRVACAGSDSDGDGYISCSGRGAKKGADDWHNLPPLQCSGGGWSAAMRNVSGCKPTPGFVNPN